MQKLYLLMAVLVCGPGCALVAASTLNEEGHDHTIPSSLPFQSRYLLQAVSGERYNYLGGDT